MRLALAAACLLAFAPAIFADATVRAVRLRIDATVPILDGARSGTQVLVIALDSDGNSTDVTDQARLEAEPAGRAAIDAAGWVAPISDGDVEIRASLDSLAASTRLTVKNASRTRPVEFRHEVLPALTRAGCNQGGCHGTPTGKNGFRLSLRGYLPEQDWATLTREFSARRIDPMAPEASLLLLMGSGAVFHQGGQRFTREGHGYQVVRDWSGEFLVSTRTKVHAGSSWRELRNQKNIPTTPTHFS